MRILITIPHYYAQGAAGKHGSSRDDVDFRVQALSASLSSLHQHFGQPQCMIQIDQRRTETANKRLSAVVHVVVCTTGNHHLLDRLKIDSTMYQRHAVHVDPKLLGFECRNVLKNRWGNYDWYGYMEDDLIHHDPWFFAKLNWFQDLVGPDAALLPNRFERGLSRLTTKAYIDGNLAERITQPYQNTSDNRVIQGTVLGQPIQLHRPLNPHSGCWFLSAQQMSHWINRPGFANRDTSFIGPLESAATLGQMQAFRIYKPSLETASFLEIEHAGQRFISQLRPPGPEDRT